MSESQRAGLAARFLLDRTPVQPRAALVLGSGWGGLIGELRGAVRVPYAQVPGMKVSTVPGHAGEWVLGQIGSTPWR